MPREIVRKTVELNADNIAWFQETYGAASSRASLSWVLDMLLTKFREAHTITPEELAAIGAAELKKMLQEGA